MIQNKKIKNGFKKIIVAITLAFPGPVLVSYASGHEKLKILLIAIGGALMLGSLILGFIAIKKLLDGFFEESNE